MIHFRLEISLKKKEFDPGAHHTRSSQALGPEQKKKNTNQRKSKHEIIFSLYEQNKLER